MVGISILSPDFDSSENIFKIALMKTSLTVIKLICIFIFIFHNQFSSAQITNTKPAEVNNEILAGKYDSTKNFLGKEVYKYIGQELYLNEKHEMLRKYGYSNFILNYHEETLANTSNVYKCCASYNSKYDSLAGNYFKVIAVHAHPKAAKSSIYEKKSYLELIEKKSGDKLYYEYDSKFEGTFPFIVVGFFDKTKKLAIGQKFVFKSKFINKSIDIKTGDSIKNTLNQKWECTDLTINDEDYELSLVLKDTTGQTIMIRYMYALGKHSKERTFSATEAIENEKKFGKKNWLTILESEIIVGFTEEMVLLSWGKPEKINRASYGEQWVYGGQYLYFKNGKLTSFN